MLNSLFVENCVPVVCLAGVVPNSSVPARVSLKEYERVAFLIFGKNATTVTGSAVTVKQSKTVAGGSEKAVPVTRIWTSVDYAADPTLVETAVVGNTFTLSAVDSKQSLTVVEVRPDDLDVDAGFDCVGIGTANATAQTVTVIAILYAPKHRGKPADLVNPQVD